MDVDLRSLRIFIKVIENNSFSAAARALRLTQPTVSQQMARLESELGGRIFERVGHEIHITDLGRKLHAYAIEVVERTERLKEDLSQERTQHVGLVRYAMPESCQWTPHFRSIMREIKKLPDVLFEIGILPSDEVLKAVQEGRMDFGFAVGERLQPELRFEHFADEAYSAVAATHDLLKPLKEKKLKDVRWIAFPGSELFLDTWSKSYGISKQVRSIQALPHVKIGTLAGAIHAVQEGAGVAIIPTHCVNDEIKSGKLKEFILDKKAASNPNLNPNPIHIVRRHGERLPARAEVVLEMLKKAKREIG